MKIFTYFSAQQINYWAVKTSFICFVNIDKMLINFYLLIYIKRASQLKEMDLNRKIKNEKNYK